jgi:DNA-binding transcriptional regulator YhcF (GntR family)
VVDKLAQQIRSEVFLPNHRLPSVRELMRTEEISLSTANRVLHELERTGFVYAKERCGFFVLPLGGNSDPAPQTALIDLSSNRLDGTLAPSASRVCWSNTRSI